MDFYDSTTPTAVASDSEVLKGIAGAAGKVEGSVRTGRRREAAAWGDFGRNNYKCRLDPSFPQSRSNNNRCRCPLVPRCHCSQGVGHSCRCGMRQRYFKIKDRRQGYCRRRAGYRLYISAIGVVRDGEKVYHEFTHANKKLTMHFTKYFQKSIDLELTPSCIIYK